MSDTQADESRISEAAEIAYQYAGIDGAHHKQWVIDQMLRILLGEEDYNEWVLRWESESADETWDEGIAP